jgi:hypothetical protein
MPSEHYVPKLYFRNWTDTGKIPVFHIENRQEYRPTSINNLAEENAFYDPDPVVDNTLSRLESEYAAVLRDLIDVESLEALDRRDWEVLYSFILFQYMRTDAFRSNISKIKSPIEQAVLERSIRNGEITEEQAEELELGDFLDDRLCHQLLLLRSILALPIISDLSAVLVKNQIEKSFIFSDHPVVLDNNYFRDRLNAVGVANRGAQFFCPISDSLLVMLYDPNCYRARTDDLRVEVESDRCVQALNDIQLLNAKEQVYYSEVGRGEEILQMLDRLSDHLEPERYSVSDIDPISSDSEEEISLRQFTNTHNLFLPFVAENLRVPFVTPRDRSLFHEYKKWEVGLREWFEGDVTKCLLYTIRNIT